MFISQTDHQFDETYLVPTPMITMYKDGKYHLINEYTLRNIQLSVVKSREVFEEFRNVTFTCEAGESCTIMVDGRLSMPISAYDVITNLISQLLVASVY